MQLLGKVAVAAAGTPERATKGLTSPTARVGAQKILIQALPGNTQKLYVGDSTMVKATGVGVIASLSAGGSVTLDIPNAPAGLNVAEVWLDADVNAEAAFVTAFTQ